MIQDEYLCKLSLLFLLIQYLIHQSNRKYHKNVLKNVFDVIG